MSAPADSSAKSQDGTSSSGRASYKAQLDEAAERAQNPDGHNGGGSEEGLVDKGTVNHSTERSNMDCPKICTHLVF